MEKTLEKPADDFTYFIVPSLSLAGLIIVFIKAAKDYLVVSVDSPNFILACLSALPYLLTFAFSFFVKTANHRKVFYGALGFLCFMTAFEWIGPKTPEMKTIYTIIWFFQIVFVVPFLTYSLRGTQNQT